MNEIQKKSKKNKRKKTTNKRHSRLISYLNCGQYYVIWGQNFRAFDVSLIKCWLLQSFHGFQLHIAKSFIHFFPPTFKPTLQPMKRPLDSHEHIAFQWQRTRESWKAYGRLLHWIKSWHNSSTYFHVLASSALSFFRATTFDINFFVMCFFASIYLLLILNFFFTLFGFTLFGVAID